MLRKVRSSWPALAAAVALSCLTSKARQAATTPFHAGVSLVHVDTEVMDANHRVLTGLHKQDFTVLDDGQPQAILNLESEEQPLDLMLLFDTSLSMRGVIQRISEGAGQAFKELRSGDRVSLMVFSSHSDLLLPFTANLAAAQALLRDRLTKEHIGGGTKIQSAIVDAARQFANDTGPGRRRAILIITDDVGLRTRREESVVESLWKVDASLNGVIVRDAKFNVQLHVTHVLSPGTFLVQAGMTGIAEKTGGDVLRSTEGAAEFTEMMHRIRSRASLYYRMPDAGHGETRDIRIKLSAEAQKRYPGAIIRARHGYIVP